MSERAALPKDHPMMIAWEEYQKTADYQNALRWTVHAEHAPGSLWAAFSTAWEQQAARIDALTFAGKCITETARPFGPQSTEVFVLRKYVGALKKALEQQP